MRAGLAILTLVMGSACGGSLSPSTSHQTKTDGGSAEPPSPTIGDDAGGATADAGGANDDGPGPVSTPPAADAADEADTNAPDAHDVTDASAPGCGDCGPGKVCAYMIADGCGATGMCVAPPAPYPCYALALDMGCGCDGTTISWMGGCKPSLPSGYAPAPVQHSGACN